MKQIKKWICMIIMALTVIVSVDIMTASDANASVIINLWDASAEDIGVFSTMTGATNGNKDYYSSKAFKVAAGDKVTIGPVFKDQAWVLTGFDANGTITQKRIKPSALEKTGSICNNAVILTYIVPEGTEYIRVANSQMFLDSTLITKNQEFNKDEYFAYMDSKRINVDYLRPTNTTDAIINKFPVSDKTFAGRVDKTDGMVEHPAYRSCEFITVQEGDVIYFAAASQSQGYHLCLQDAEGKGTLEVTSPFMVLYEDLGRGYAIYAYRMRPGTARATVIVGTGVYDDGIALVTVNQPFTGDSYREMFHVDLDEDILDETSPLNGLTGLFMGDSISYGYSDYLSYKDSYVGRAWAGRIEAFTGLTATNASVSGAKASYVEGDNSDLWLFNQHTAHVGKNFDIIVIQGGVNDARYERIVGTSKPIDATEDELKANLDTYIGGLQWLFHNVKAKFPDSTLFFIANHKLDGHNKGQAQNMSPYFDAAEELCEMYGINFIDLYNNTELNNKLETTTTKYLPDTLHLNAAGYDILTPYIIEAIEDVMAPDETPDETPNGTQEGDNGSNNDTKKTNATTQTSAPQTGDSTDAFAYITLLCFAMCFIVGIKKQKYECFKYW